jgi:outer membrane protein assembly factor BamE (lipoprotein component of BamABCDE complex)
MGRGGQRAANRGVKGSVKGLTLALALAMPLGGCSFGETFQRGYVLPEGALEQIRLGASQEQVLIVLGTPSTVATV